MTRTIFSKIIDREIPATIVYEDEEIIAFNDIESKAPVHVLIVPKKIIPTVNDVNPDDTALLGKIFLVAKQIAAEKNISESGYRLVMNCNSDAGQTVFHIHCHLLGGKKLTNDFA